MLRNICLAVVMASVHLLSGASETVERQAVVTDVVSAFQREDFAHIERRYAEMNKNTERLPSGVLKSARLLYALMEATRLPRDLRHGPDIQERQEAHWIAMEEKTARWQQAYPASSIAAFARSEAFIGHAFFFRGERLAREVDPSKWKSFHAYIGRANETLAQGKLRRDPAWYCAMLKVAQFSGMDTEQFVRLVGEASDKYPYFYDIYFFAANRLQPKWGGSPEAFEWLASLAVNKTRKVEGMSLYARLYWSIGQGDFSDDLFTATLADWKKMRAGFDDIVKRYPSEWNLNNYAWFACLARDQATLKRVFERIGSDIDRSLWQAPERLNRCRNFARDGE